MKDDGKIKPIDSRAILLWNGLIRDSLKAEITQLSRAANRVRHTSSRRRRVGINQHSRVISEFHAVDRYDLIADFEFSRRTAGVHTGDARLASVIPGYPHPVITVISRPGRRQH